MPDDSLQTISQAAAVAAGAGAGARVLVAVRDGTRGRLLIVEGLFGGALGTIAAALTVWMSPDLRDVGWSLFILGGVAGLAGALGNRALDLLLDGLKKGK